MIALRLAFDRFDLPARQTGLLVMGPASSHAYQQTKATLLRNHIPMVPLSRDTFSRHIPNVTLPPGDEAVVDVGAGILYADRALKTARVRVHTCGGGGTHPDANANVRGRGT